MFDPKKVKIKNLQSQFSMFFAKKGKIGHYTSPDFNILKIKN